MVGQNKSINNDIFLSQASHCNTGRWVKFKGRKKKRRNWHQNSLLHCCYLASILSCSYQMLVYLLTKSTPDPNRPTCLVNPWLNLLSQMAIIASNLPSMQVIFWLYQFLFPFLFVLFFFFFKSTHHTQVTFMLKAHES